MTCVASSLRVSPKGPVTAPAQAVKGSVIRSLILHLGPTPPAKTGFMYHRLLFHENNRSKINLAILGIAVSLFYDFPQNI